MSACSPALGDPVGEYRIVRIISRGGSKPLFEESQHSVERLLGRMPVVVDQLLGEDTVGHTLDPPRIVGAGVDLDSLEPLAKLSAQRFESRTGADRVGSKPEAKHLHTFFAHPSLDNRELLSGRMDPATSGLSERER